MTSRLKRRAIKRAENELTRRGFSSRLVERTARALSACGLSYLPESMRIFLTAKPNCSFVSNYVWNGRSSVQTACFNRRVFNPAEPPAISIRLGTRRPRESMAKLHVPLLMKHTATRVSFTNGRDFTSRILRIIPFPTAGLAPGFLSSRCRISNKAFALRRKVP